MTSLHKKIALVTGGVSGMGAAAADLLEEKGAHVVRADVSRVDNANAVILDVTRESHWQDVVRHLSLLGGVDILVNAAGLSLENDTVERCSAETWHRTIAVNLDGTFLSCKYILPLMANRGGGSIVNFGSINSIVGDGNAVAYVASKGGVRLLTKSIALHCAKVRNNVRCNVICPGYIETPMLTDWLSHQPIEARARLERYCPSGRLGHPSEVAGLVAYLASDEAGSVTGSEFVVDGGYVAQ